MRRFVTLTAVIVIALAALTACGGSTSLQRSDATRILVTAPPQSVVDANFAFGLGVLRNSASAGGNVALSPVSIMAALVMALDGAKGETQVQLRRALQLGDIPPGEADNGMNALTATTVPPAGGHAASFDLANAVWTRQGLRLLPSYLDVLAKTFGAGVEQAPFQTDPDGARGSVNAWVADHTKGRIRDLLAQGTVTRDTALILVDAAWFKDRWASPFPKAATVGGTFTMAGGTQVQAPMMHEQEQLGYAALPDGTVAVNLPYADSRFAMTIVLPSEPGGPLAGLDAAKLQTLFTSLQERRVALSMPKFTFTSRLDLVDVLRQLGANDAFVPSLADFSGMDGRKDLFISTVTHQAFVAVDEAGTEAAAATAVGMGATAIPAGPDPVAVDVDHPFLFALRDTTNGAVLFLGSVGKPTASAP